MIPEALLAAAPTHVPLAVGGHTIRMVPVKGGTFMMGDEGGNLWNSERPVHPVRLDDFWIGQFPVTQVLWRVVCLTPGPSPEESGNALDPSPARFKGDRRPVERVSWEDAQVFLVILNRLLPGWNFRLPTEAEWEYTARGGHYHVVLPLNEGRGRGYYSGSDRLEAVAWWDENSQNEPKPVGLKLPNALGLFDMCGNVYEWCEDWFGSNFFEKCAKKGTVLNPRNDEGHSVRVVRAAPFKSNTQFCRVASRDGMMPSRGGITLGFRLAASPSS